MNASIKLDMSFADIATLLGLSILWGGSFFFIEILVEYFPPLTIVTLRVGCAALILWVFVILTRVPLPKGPDQWTAMAVIGLINNALPFALITWGQTYISSGLASIFNATTPFFTVIVAAWFLSDEGITRNKYLGVAIGFAGIIVLVGPDALTGMTGPVLGQLAVIGAAISYAFAAAFSRRFKRWGLSPMMVATGQVSMAAVILLPLTLYFEQPWTLAAPPMTGVAAMFGLVVLSTVLAYILYFRLIAFAGATNAALVTFLIPVSAILLGVFILGESFTKGEAFGMVLVALGLLVMDGRLWKRLNTQT